MDETKNTKEKYINFFFILFILAAIYFTSRYNFLFFHAIIEIYSSVIAFGIFIITWNTKKYLDNNYLLIIGIAFLFVGFFDILHALSYKGMNIVYAKTPNLSTELWIAARYLESLSLFSAFLFNYKKINYYLTFFIYSFISIAFILLIFHFDIFPDCYIENSGLTKFKIISEYVILFFLILTILLLIGKKNQFDKNIFRLLLCSLFFSVLSEFSFTLYTDVYGYANQIGHYFKIISFYFIYNAIIKNGMNKPLTLLFRDLKQTKEKYMELVENLQNGILVLDKNYKIIFANAGFREMINNEIKNLINKDIFSFIEEDKKHAKIKFERLKNNATQKEEFLLKNNDKSKISALFETNIINSFENKFHGLIISVRDITNEKKRENELFLEKQSCETALNEKSVKLLFAEKELTKSKRLSDIGTLAATIAHELRNPLGVIRIAAYNIRKKSFGPAVLEKHIDNIEKKVNESAKIIDNLLNYSKIKMPIFTDVNIYNILNESITSIKTINKPANTVFFVNIKNIKNILIRGDMLQLKELFQNLLNNAYQATENKKGKISVKTEVIENNVLKISIKDNGTGIDENDLEHVFNPFFTRKSKGTGLGLTICKEIIDLHEGKIKIKSKINRGTEISVELFLRNNE